MLHHRTTNPAQRASHVAEREAQRRFSISFQWGEFFQGQLALYEKYLKEFSENPEKELADVQS